MSKIQSGESGLVAHLCQAIRDQNLLSGNQYTLACAYAITAAEEISVVTEQLRVKFRLGDSSGLEMGLINSGSGCNLLPLSYCKRYGFGMKGEQRATQVKGFNGSFSEAEGYLDIWVKIGPWKECQVFGIC